MSSLFCFVITMFSFARLGQLRKPEVGEVSKDGCFVGNRYGFFQGQVIGNRLNYTMYERGSTQSEPVGDIVVLCSTNTRKKKKSNHHQQPTQYPIAQLPMCTE
ncbi:hypothetical protein TWF225_003362 [Orbilia oligospora]|uniref:Uncharacterized protein n=1 Tax=Orbilia oligospora TaxID=2813651 RepID=A0A7C8JYT2_ORBOL|nr:hypothetical protein TWF751_001193 [Orbilia oligospora]KAF3188380.1 hypothetical protein TWF225_003362 [Orbilia oligospora]KAF3240269.1 hypothetical protein TWF217_000856 [Orbilia oligospora]KAF3258530.1 hypothetical protein TWF128_004758 [Orbilia oligospora]KAF3281322.1 hypothetical protein TWF132_011319 [Orbilia oligospora]